MFSVLYFIVSLVCAGISGINAYHEGLWPGLFDAWVRTAPIKRFSKKSSKDWRSALIVGFSSFVLWPVSLFTGSVADFRVWVMGKLAARGDM